MKSLLLLVLTTLLSTSAIAATDFFTRGPGNPELPSPNPKPEAFAARVEFPVEVNLRGIANQPDRLSIQFVDGSRLTFSVLRFEPVAGFDFAPDGTVTLPPETPERQVSYNWYGVGEGSQLLLTVYQGLVSATATLPEAIYSVSETRQGTVFRELDPQAFPPDIVSGESSDGKIQSVPDLLNSPSYAKYRDTINILVLHTPAVLALAQSRDQLNSRINETFVQLNTALENSGIISVGVSNVATGTDLSTEIGYDEQNAQTCQASIPPALCPYFGHRVFLRNNAFAQSQRNQTQADLVLMLVADVEAACGVSYLQRPNCGVDDRFNAYETGCGVGDAYNSFAYAVVSYDCATQYQAFAHEIGHQFGGEHNPENGCTPQNNCPDGPSFPWSFGHYVNGQAETLMSIRGLLSACPNGCPRVLQFSNPNIGFVTFPATPSGTGTRFNARTIAALAPTISGFRGPTLMGLIYRNSFEALPIPN